MNPAFWDRLSPDQQKAVQTSIDDAGAYAADLGLAAESENIKTLDGLKQYTTVITNIDRAAFVARARELDQRMVPVWGNLYQQILDSQK